MPMERHTRTPPATARSSSDRTSIALITGGVGHNLPQEAPGAFAEAVINLASRRS